MKYDLYRLASYLKLVDAVPFQIYKLSIVLSVLPWCRCIWIPSFARHICCFPGRATGCQAPPYLKLYELETNKKSSSGRTTDPEELALLIDRANPSIERQNAGHSLRSPSRDRRVMLPKLRKSLQKHEHKRTSPPSITSKTSHAIEPPKAVIKALYDYTQGSPQELSFNKGDFFHVVGNEHDQNWYSSN